MVLVWENNTTEEYIMCCYMFLLLQVLEKDLTKGVIRSHVYHVGGSALAYQWAHFLLDTSDTEEHK
jgi:hypothetical protein